MPLETHSERVFAAICEREGYSIEKIKAGSSKTPDFRVRTPVCEILAEVKEIRPNRREREQIAEFSKTGMTTFGAKVGARARKEIERKRPKTDPWGFGM